MTLSGKLIENIVVIEKNGIDELYNTSFYGRPRGNILELSLPESAYLARLGKISVECEGEKLDFKQFFLRASAILKNFELFYIVYKDLRERGYYAQPGVTGFRVYPRGGHPGKTPSDFFVLITSERTPLLLSDLKKHLETVNNLKKRLILAIVDEESDITFYEVRKTIPSGSCEFKINKALSVASLLEDRCMVWDSKASSLLHKEGFFGKLMDEGHLQLSLVESAYLLNKEVLEIESRNNERLDFDEFSRLASRIESDFMTKYRVYEKLRNSGLIPKTGFKFGTHFRVYRSYEDQSSLSHSEYLVHAIENKYVFSLQQLSRAVRLANSVKKEMIYGTVNSQVDFFIIGRMRL
ncbi:MAG: tRNA-intron lyase [Candidatus Methanoperedens sp.]|nr:tRNA-intron lyase [Candidatus Methanoperedens sp.]MCZ7371389.1 tRNA-intron lyase [Candidatus Methanoperedens sp.]